MRKTNRACINCIRYLRSANSERGFCRMFRQVKLQNEACVSGYIPVPNPKALNEQDKVES